jgi:hypothetical protein
MMSSPGERLEQILEDGRSHATRALGEEGAAVLHTRAKARYLEIEPTIPLFQQSTNRALFVLGPPVLAIYQALQSDLGVDRAPALRLVEEMLLAFYRKQMKKGPILGAAMSLALRLKPARSLLLRSLAVDEPEGFLFEKIDDPGALMAFDVRECALVKFARRHGAPEIVPMLCRLDDLAAASLSGIELRRTGTIATGAARCDFRYVKARR